MIPILYVSQLSRSVDFYTKMLDFIPERNIDPDDVVVYLKNQQAYIQLSILPGDQKAGISVMVQVVNLAALYDRYSARGINQSDRKESPVHQAPLRQSWGTLEWYVTDPDGNTLRFVEFPE